MSDVRTRHISLPKSKINFLFASVLVYHTAVYAAADNTGIDFPGQLTQKKQEWNGYYLYENAYRYLEPRSITKMRHTLFIRNSYNFSSRYKLFFAGRAYYDLVYDLFDYKTIVAREEREKEQPLVFVDNLNNEKDSPVAEIRELYLDLSLNNLDVRIGKQHIVWGVLEGVRVVDEINPMNFRELILPEYILDYRIALWSIKADFYRDSGTYQMIWIPEMAFHKPAPRGSEWELFQEVPNTSKPISSNLRNSEIALRWSKNIFNNDIQLSYFYTWDDFPAIFRSANNLQDEDPTLFPTYTRINMYGATWQRQIFGQIVKAEYAYVTGKYFGISQRDLNNDAVLDDNGELKRNHVRWGVGLDLHFRAWDISPAFIQWDIINYDPAILQKKHDRAFNLYMRKKFKRGNTTFTSLWIYLIDLEDSLWKTKFTFGITDKVNFGAGMDIFFGHKSTFGVVSRDNIGGGPLSLPGEVEQRTQFFGNFDDNDRIYFELKYSF